MRSFLIVNLNNEIVFNSRGWKIKILIFIKNLRNPIRF